MRDPDEGSSEAGVIETGALRQRIAGAFTQVLDEAVQAVQVLGDPAGLCVYGSGATGQARVGQSDVDVLTIDVDNDHAAALATDLSRQFRSVCRGVEIASPAHTEDLEQGTDEALRQQGVSWATSTPSRCCQLRRATELCPMVILWPSTGAASTRGARSHLGSRGGLW